jgi:nitrite reductase/ring-hydroxylating ferredoxin subunit
MTDDVVTRRTAVRGLALVGLGAPVLAACGAAEDEPTAGTTPDATAGGTSDPAAPSTPTDDATAPGAALAATSEIPVGGGKVFDEEKIVVVQPTEGDFKAYSAVCPHQSCIFTEVNDNAIRCGGCHQSEFSSLDGVNTVGPNGGEANLRPLGEVAITVSGDSISLG